MGGPPKVSGNKLKKLERLIEEWTRLEVGLRLGVFPRDMVGAGGLSLANDVVDKADEIRRAVFGVSDLTSLAHHFGFMGKRD